MSRSGSPRIGSSEMGNWVLSRHDILSGQPNTSVGAAGSQTGFPNWIDVVGNIWNINSGVVQAAFPNSAVPSFAGWAARPTGENQRDQREVLTVPAGFTSAAGYVPLARVQGNRDCYLGLFGASGIFIMKFVGGASTILNTYNFSVDPNQLQFDGTHSYTFDFSAQNVDGAPEATITFIVTDTTSGKSATLTAVDSASTLQGSGQYAFSATGINTHAKFSDVQLFVWRSIKASLSEIKRNAATTLHALGTGTNFQTGVSNLQPPPGSSAAITSQTVLNTGDIQFTIATGTDAPGPLTLTETDSGETFQIPVLDPYYVSDQEIVPPESDGDLDPAAVVNLTGHLTHDIQANPPTFDSTNLAGCSVKSWVVTGVNTARVKLLTDGSNGGMVITEETDTPPAPVTVQIQARIPVDHAAIRRSRSWVVAGSGLGAVARTPWSGAWAKVLLNTSRCDIRVDVSRLLANGVSSGFYPFLETVYVENGEPFGWNSVQLTGSTFRVNAWSGKDASVQRELRWYFRDVSNGVPDQWGLAPGAGGLPVMSLDEIWLEVDVACVPAMVSVKNPLWWLTFGDSITWGALTQSGITGRGYEVYARAAADILGFDNYATFGVSGLGWAKSGAGGRPIFHQPSLPAASQVWANNWNGQPLDVSQVGMVTVNLGTNDAQPSNNIPGSLVVSTMQDAMPKMRQVFPYPIPIIFMVPFGQFYAEYVHQGAANPPDRRFYVYDAGAENAAGLDGSGLATFWSQDGTHPNKDAHAMQGARFAAWVLRAVELPGAAGRYGGALVRVR